MDTGSLRHGSIINHPCIDGYNHVYSTEDDADGDGPETGQNDEHDAGPVHGLFSRISFWFSYLLVIKQCFNHRASISDSEKDGRDCIRQ